MQQLKGIILSWWYSFLGISITNIPFAIIYLGFLYKGGDTDFIGGIILYILQIFFGSLLIVFIDILIFRFLFKKNLNRYTFLGLGFTLGCIFLFLTYLISQ